MRLRRWLCGALVSLTALTACQGSASSDAGCPRGALTFNKDIAPILFEHCGSCHRLGEPAATAGAPAAGAKPTDGTSDQWCIAGAPFSLIEYRDVRAHATQIASATRKRTMPPWLPEPGLRRLRQRAPASRRPDRDDRALGDAGRARRRPRRQATDAELAQGLATGRAGLDRQDARSLHAARPRAATSFAIS